MSHCPFNSILTRALSGNKHGTWQIKFKSLSLVLLKSLSFLLSTIYWGRNRRKRAKPAVSQSAHPFLPKQIVHIVSFCSFFNFRSAFQAFQGEFYLRLMIATLAQFDRKSKNPVTGKCFIPEVFVPDHWLRERGLWERD